MQSLTFMATQSMPTVSHFWMALAISTFEPTPSVHSTSASSLPKSMRPAKWPILPMGAPEPAYVRAPEAAVAVLAAAAIGLVACACLEASRRTKKAGPSWLASVGLCTTGRTTFTPLGAGEARLAGLAAGLRVGLALRAGL